MNEKNCFYLLQGEDINSMAIEKIKADQDRYSSWTFSECPHNKITEYRYSWADKISINGKKMYGKYESLVIWYLNKFNIYVIFTPSLAILSHIRSKLSEQLESKMDRVLFNGSIIKSILCSNHTLSNMVYDTFDFKDVPVCGCTLPREGVNQTDIIGASFELKMNNRYINCSIFISGLVKFGINIEDEDILCLLNFLMEYCKK